jgi:hypothetical protein
MFAHKLKVEISGKSGELRAVPLKWLDSFAMRNFTNDAAFDDTLPLGDGLMEAGNRVATDALRDAMVDWFRRKGWLDKEDKLYIVLADGL